MVSWWVGVTQTAGTHQPDSEVDQISWLPVDQAAQLLTYADERAVLDEALQVPETTPLILLRHAKAKSQLSWKLDNTLRPLEPRGKAQLTYINQLLRSFAATWLISSPAVRCTQTLDAYAAEEDLRLDVERLVDVSGSETTAIADYAQELAHEVVGTHTPTVVCTHRSIFPVLLKALDVEPRPLSPGSCVILHLNSDGEVFIAEWQDTLRVKVK